MSMSSNRYEARGRSALRRSCLTSTALLVGFLVVCLAEVAVGIMLWADVSYAPTLSYALLPFEFAFWIGFALPFGPLLGIARTALLLLA